MPKTPLLRASEPVKVSTNPFTTVAVILRGGVSEVSKHED